jgi:hypothetical protein
MITEAQLEKLCISWFESIGYDSICGYNIAPMAETKSVATTDKSFCMNAC